MRLWGLSLLLGIALCAVAHASIDTQGQTGILSTPTAEVISDGDVEFTIQRHLSRVLAEARGDQRSRTYSLTIGYLPRFEATMRFSDYPNAPDLSNGLANFQDRSAAIKYQLAVEDDWSFAVGATDIGGESRKQDTYYGVASWRADDKLTLSAGMGTDLLEGTFGSVEYRPSRTVTLLAEHDTEDFNYGVELTPLRNVHIKLAQLNDSSSISAGFSMPLNPRAKDTACCPVEIPVCETTYADHCEQAAAVRDALVAESFENVLVGSDGTTLFVEFENRRWREQIDALGVAALLAAKCAGPGIDCVVLVPKVEDVPMLTLQASLADWRTLLQQPGDCTGVSISNYTPGGYPQGTQFAAEANKKPGGGDVFIRPTQNLVVAESGQPVWRTNWGLGLTENAFFARGWKLQARQDWPLLNDIQEKTEPFQRDAFAVYLDRWADDVYVSGVAGQLRGGTYGAGGHIQYELDERLRVGGRYEAWQTDGSTDPSSGVMLGEVSYDFPALDLEVTALTGRFLNGDEGLRLESRRYFGPTELTFFAYDTDRSSTHGGFRVSIPLGPYSERRHGDWRVGSAPYFSYQYRTDEDPVGQSSMAPGFDITTLRQRLRPDYVREHLDDMRRGAWLYLNGD